MKQEAWIVAVDMGYGHQRAAFPLRRLAPDGKIINANNYEGIPERDKKIWNRSRRFYEFVSRLTRLPLVGGILFGLYDRLQAIPSFYPRRDLSRMNISLSQMYRLIRRGWGKDLVNFLNRKDIPLITTFFAVAFFAEEHGFKNEIYCVVCDSDVSRTWAPLKPQKSRIKYLCPCHRAVSRLKLYGVPEKNIFLTGFPLPEENMGGSELHVLKSDLTKRLAKLDPEKRYHHKYGGTIHQYLNHHPSVADRPLTLTFAVGGAGAQQGLAENILKSLKKKILAGEIAFNLVAGSRNDVFVYFRDRIKQIGLGSALGKNLNIIFGVHKDEYFYKFNECLRTTDVLWTKPSELVFYCALGLPVITAPSIGSQEIFNRIWLKTVGAGISQEKPIYTHEWLYDWVKSGWLAEAAMSGFLDGRQFGVANICDVVFKGVKEPTKDDDLL